MEYSLAFKKADPDICNFMDEPGGHKWIKFDTER
jgi:hypothetical protein